MTTHYDSAAMIYCVVPRDLADELLPQLTAYYADDPNVAVIVDRREGSRRGDRSGAPRGDASRRVVRDRRRPRVVGELPATPAGSAG